MNKTGSELDLSASLNLWSTQGVLNYSQYYYYYYYYYYSLPVLLRRLCIAQ